MLIDTNNETICINKNIGQKSITSIFEEDFVVPDIKPDILNIINTSGTICVYKKEILDGRVKIDGSIDTYVMYLSDTEENQLRSINVNLDFSQIIELDNLKENMLVNTDIIMKQIEGRIINGRKLNIRAILDFNLNAYSTQNIDYISDIKDDYTKDKQDKQDIQLLKGETEINALLGNGATKTYAKDTIVLNENDEVAEVLKVDYSIINKEKKISYNKILLKADCSIKILYLTHDNRICIKNAIIPIMGFIDIQEIDNECICDIQYEIKNILLKVNNNEENSIYVEIEIDINCSSYKRRKINLIEDIYSTKNDIEYKQNTLEITSQLSEIQDIYQIREKVYIEEIKDNKIHNIDTKISITNRSIGLDTISFEGEVELSILSSLNDSSSIRLNTYIIPFNYNMKCSGDSKIKIDTSLEITNQDFIVMPDGSIDVKLDIKIIAKNTINKEIKLINEINVNDNVNTNRPSIVIYYIKPNDTLWNIAKRFKSTTESIINMNELEDGKNLKVGSQLFIPASSN